MSIVPFACAPILERRQERTGADSLAGGTEDRHGRKCDRARERHGEPAAAMAWRGLGAGGYWHRCCASSLWMATDFSACIHACACVSGLFEKLPCASTRAFGRRLLVHFAVGRRSLRLQCLDARPHMGPRHDLAGGKKSGPYRSPMTKAPAGKGAKMVCSFLVASSL
eukprot:6068527-Pleurochrysis_carterae.AAC.1